MTRGWLLVVDSDWNRENAASLIGKRFDPKHPPSYSALKYERDLMMEMTDDELVAFWNIRQSGKRMIQAGDVETQERLEVIADELLTERHIPHESGKRIVKTPA